MAKWQTLKTRPIACVYMILHAGEILYIGQSSNLELRLEQHRVRWLKAYPATEITVKYKILEDYLERLEYEKELITKHRPKHNLTVKVLENVPIELRPGLAATDYIKL